MRFAVLVILFACLMWGPPPASIGAATPKAPTPAPLSPRPQGAEIAFVSSIQQDLMHRFPAVADAKRAGYFRYTTEDYTGSISYVNLQWTSADPRHPSQLWYDVHGNLLGADFSRPLTSEPPMLWAINPKRWIIHDKHIHWVAVDAHGTESFGESSVEQFVKAGGNLAHPTGAPVPQLSRYWGQLEKKAHMPVTPPVKSAAQVTHIFVFPAIWDLVVWVKPNPNGAFADKNPLVIPSKNADKY